MKSWQTLLEEYRKLKIAEAVDFEKFNQYAITHHSTALEGSTLTLTDTQLLLDESITPKGKPISHSFMVRDHFEALKLVLSSSDLKVPITVDYIQKINAKVMANTGSIYNTPLGTVNAAAGEFRKGNVTAGQTYFVNYDKVVPYTKEFVAQLNEKLATLKNDNQKEIMKLSFVAHFDLVSIHPFYDGNGRTSRLLMNDIQHRFNMPVSTVFNEDRAEYIQALIESREQESTTPIVNFMFSQYSKQLQQEITAYKKGVGLQMKPKGKRGLSLFF